MTARLGNALYWIACIMAVGWAAIAFYAESISAVPRWGMAMTVGLGVSAVIWFIGRTVRYVLGGV